LGKPQPDARNESGHDVGTPIPVRALHVSDAQRKAEGDSGRYSKGTGEKGLGAITPKKRIRASYFAEDYHQANIWPRTGWLLRAGRHRRVVFRSCAGVSAWIASLQRKAGFRPPMNACTKRFVNNNRCKTLAVSRCEGWAPCGLERVSILPMIASWMRLAMWLHAQIRAGGGAAAKANWIPWRTDSPPMGRRDRIRPVDYAGEPMPVAYDSAYRLDAGAQVRVVV